MSFHSGAHRRVMTSLKRPILQCKSSDHFIAWYIKFHWCLGAPYLGSNDSRISSSLWGLDAHLWHFSTNHDNGHSSASSPCRHLPHKVLTNPLTYIFHQHFRGHVVEWLFGDWGYWTVAKSRSVCAWKVYHEKIQPSPNTLHTTVDYNEFYCSKKTIYWSSLFTF